MARKQTLKSLKNKAWKLVSRYVRLREADEGQYVHCYTCSRPIHAILEAQAGHAIPGRHNAVLLDDEICRPQCSFCNLKPPFGRGGEHHIFATKLIRERGMDWWESKLARAKETVKYTQSDLEDLIAEFKTKLESLNG